MIIFTLYFLTIPAILFSKYRSPLKALLDLLCINIYYLIIALRIEEMIVMTKEASKAVVKDSTLKPSIIFEAIIIRMALMTKRKSPRVRMVAGSVRIIRRGFTKRFRMARTRATITAVV